LRPPQVPFTYTKEPMKPIEQFTERDCINCENRDEFLEIIDILCEYKPEFEKFSDFQAITYGGNIQLWPTDVTYNLNLRWTMNEGYNIHPAKNYLRGDSLFNTIL
jgi:hypothetical protein